MKENVKKKKTRGGEFTDKLLAIDELSNNSKILQHIEYFNSIVSFSVQFQFLS